MFVSICVWAKKNKIHVNAYVYERRLLQQCCVFSRYICTLIPLACTFVCYLVYVACHNTVCYGCFALVRKNIIQTDKGTIIIFIFNKMLNNDAPTHTHDCHLVDYYGGLGSFCLPKIMKMN